MALTDTEAIIHDLLRMARRSPRGEDGRREMASLIATHLEAGAEMHAIVPTLVGLIYSWTRPLYQSR